MSFKLINNFLQKKVSNLNANLLQIYLLFQYLDHYYPKVGGYPINLGKEESELTHHQSLRLAVRQAIRDSIAVTFGVIVSQPFTGNEIF